MGLKQFKAYQLALDLHKECQKLKVRGELRDQLQRASLSVVLNLAEGSAKPTARDQRKFFAIALGSLREVEAIFDVMSNITEASKIDQLGAMIFTLCQNRSQ